MILVISSSYPSHPGDYRGAFVKQFTHQLAAQGQTARVLTPALFDTPVPRGPRTGNLESVPVIHFGLGHHLRPFGHLFGRNGLVNNLKRYPHELRYLPAAMIAATRELETRAPGADLIVAHWLLPFGWVAARIRKRTATPVWVVCHSGGVGMACRLPRPLRHRLGRNLAIGVDHISFVTPEVREKLFEAVGPWRRELKSKASILPMGLDLKNFAQVSPAPSGPIVVAARLTRLKGIDRLIWAVSRQQGKKPRLKIIGDGPEKRRLRRQAKRLGVQAEFVGSVGVDQMAATLKAASMAALPSRRTLIGRSEGFPVFALEALASGLPLLTTTTWAIPSSLDDLAGVFRVADNRAAVTRGLTDAWHYAQQQTKEDADSLRRAVSPFDWDLIGERVRRTAAHVIEGSSDESLFEPH